MAFIALFSMFSDGGVCLFLGIFSNVLQVF